MVGDHGLMRLSTCAMRLSYAGRPDPSIGRSPGSLDQLSVWLPTSNATFNIRIGLFSLITFIFASPKVLSDQLLRRAGHDHEKLSGSL